MKKIVGAIAILLIAGVMVFALPVLPANKGTGKAKGPSPAIDDDTGEVKAPPEFVAQLPESQLTKIVFIRYAPGKESKKPCDYDGVCDSDEKGWCSDCKGNGGGEEPPEATCYGFLAGSKPRWNWIENYSYSTGDLKDSATLGVSIWESATPGDIFGNGISGVYPWGVYDYYNSVSYGNYSEEGVIAVTAIWFRGKNIYEYDIQFDTDYFPNAGSPDLDTVVLHEFGHGAGLDDLYDVACVSEVMYGVYDGVDLDLGPGDIAGIQKLYGA